MPRSKDLDLVAPDDLTAGSNNSTPVKENKQPIVKKSSSSGTQPKATSPKPPPSEFREKVYEILGHTKTSLSAILVKPKVFSFIERDDNEEILVVLRRHWVTNVPWLITVLLMLFVPSILNYAPIFDGFPLAFQFTAIIFWYLIVFAYFLEQFYSWYFNVYIITEERVIDIDFNNLLNKKFTEAKLSMIQDVTSSIKGLGGTMFNYGDILIQTASEIPEIIFERVPNPERIIKVLGQLRQEEELETLEGRVK